MFYGAGTPQEIIVTQYFRLGSAVLGEYRYTLEEAAKIADPEMKAAYMRAYYAERSGLEGLEEADRETYRADVIADQMVAQSSALERIRQQQAELAKRRQTGGGFQITPTIAAVGALALVGLLALRRFA